MSWVGLIGGSVALLWWGTLLALMWIAYLRDPQNVPHPHPYSRAFYVWMPLACIPTIYGALTI